MEEPRMMETPDIAEDYELSGIVAGVAIGLLLVFMVITVVGVFAGLI